MFSILVVISFALCSVHSLNTSIILLKSKNTHSSASNYGLTVIDTATNKTTELEPWDGVIKVSTTSDYQNFKTTIGDTTTIPLYLKFVSHHKPSTTITIDPKSETALNCYVSLGRNKGSIRINDYIDYNQKGTIVLKNDTVVQITMTIKIPQGLWTYDRPRLIPFNLYGIDNVDPIELEFKGDIDV